jgi:hypothetical protein
MLELGILTISISQKLSKKLSLKNLSLIIEVLTVTSILQTIDILIILIFQHIHLLIFRIINPKISQKRKS